MNLRFSLLGLISLVSVAGLASAALVTPGAWWLSIVVSLVALVLIIQLVRAALTTGQARASAIGWLLVACSYVALTQAPWLKDQIGRQLITTKALVYAQAQWRKESADVPYDAYVRRLTLDPWGWGQVASGATLTVDNAAVWTTYALNDQGLAIPQPANHFQLSGQWLWTLGAGWLGSVLAGLFYRRRDASSQT